MKCPYCEAEMKYGQFVVEGTWVRMLLIVGVSWQSLWFKPDMRAPGEKRKQLVLDGNVKRAGYRCPECGAAVVGR